MSRRICGVDEVGRGPLAGPVVAAACVFPEGYKNEKIKDSKKLSSKKRELIIEEIQRDALDWAIVAVGPAQIEQINIREASRLAMSLAVERLEADLVLVDGNVAIECSVEQRTVIGGDAKHVEIGAASILAKVWRDKLMELYGAIYPAYGFEGHAGYPTPPHKRAIQAVGPCPIHRRTFAGVKEFVALVR